MSEYQRLVDSTKFDGDEFFGKWEKARKAALISTLKQKNIDANQFQSERELLLLISDDIKETLLKNVYDNSRKFALSAAKFLGVSLDLSDFEDLFKISNIPCLSGKWDASIESRVLRRDGCALGRELKSLACDYYREAIDGLVMGASEEERYARHESIGNGDSECVDLFFIESVNHESNLKIRFKPISSEILESLEPIKVSLKKSSIDLQLLGLAEGKLYYRLDAQSGPLCQSTGKYFHQKFEADVKAIYPTIQLQDMLPIAVYGSGA